MSMLTTNEIKPFSKPGIGIGGVNNEASASLNIQSATQGVLFPRVTTAQRNAISSPAEGLLLYNTSAKQFEVFDGTIWSEPSEVQIQDEIQNRIAADLALQQALDAEEAARIVADSGLQTQLNSEISTRASADTLLQGQLASEQSARIASDNTLQANINAEQTARVAADTVLQSNINAETAARLAFDTQIQLDLNNEVNIRMAADAGLQSQITAEVSARTNADSNLQSQLNAEAAARSSADSALQTDVNSRIPLAQKGAANGVATLGADQKIPSSQLPALAISSVFVVNSQAAQLALNAQEGDLAKRTDLVPLKVFIHNGGTSGTMSDWTDITTQGEVQSVNGLVGNVNLTTTQVSEGSNLYYSDARADARIAVQKAAPNGIATLDGSTKIPIAQLSTAAPVTIGTANAQGISSSIPRADHVHAHGDQPGGTLHALATQSVAGFFSAPDKTRLDAATGRHGAVMIFFTDATASTTFASAGVRFPWKNDRNSSYSNGTCIFSCTINAVNRPLQVRAYDILNAVQLGVSATITASGFYTFTFNKPTTDTYIELQVRQTISGSPAPSVELASIEWNTV